MKTRIILATLVLALGAACATAPQGAKDAAAVQGFLEQWREAMLSKDIDRIMALHSERFKAGDRDKAAQATWLKAEIENDGLVDNAMIIYEHATIIIEGDRATVKPIAISTPVGSGSIKLELLREDGQWRVSSMSN